MHVIPRVLVPSLAACCCAAELPVSAVVVTPQGAVVTRCGALPAGDQAVTGLPLALDRDSLGVRVDGDRQPAWQLEVPALPSTPAASASAAALAEAERALLVARERAALARTLLDQPAVPPASTAAALPLPSAAAQQAAAAFLRSNLERAAAEEAAALAACERLRPLPADLPAAAGLHLVGAGLAGRRVTVTYRLPGAGWRPRYRIAVVDGAAELAVAAVVELRDQDRWPALPLELASRSATAQVLAPIPQVTQLGVPEAVFQLAPPAAPAPAWPGYVADVELGGGEAFMAIGAGGGGAGMFGSRSGGARKRALGMAGGSQASGAAVDKGLRRLDASVSPEGWWGQGPARVRTTAQVLLAYLGAGFEGKTPSRHRHQVQQGLRLLAAQDPAALDLGSLALCTAALAEAYGMSNDHELRPAAQRCHDQLALRCARREEVQAGLQGEGPLLAVRLAQAARVCVAAGLAAPLVAQLDWLPAQVAAAGDHETARIAEAALAGLLRAGNPALPADPAEAERWGQLVPSWLAAGRCDLIECSAWAAFSAGSAVFARWNRPARDLLVAQQQADGGWAVAGGEPDAAIAALVSTLETYWRYRARSGHPGLYHGTPADPVACPWPVRWRVAPVAVVPGRPVEVEVGRWPLAGARALNALPALGAQVWQRWQGVNPLPGALPGGPCALVVDGRAVGDIALSATRPGGALEVPLGPEPRARVVRSLVPSSDDGMFRRTLEVVLRWRLEAWPGCPPVEVVEPLPRVAHPRIELEFTNPPLAGAALEERRGRDPFWRHVLTPQAPEQQVAWRLTYPADIRPFLEAQP